MKTNVKKIITLSVILTFLVTAVSCVLSYIAMSGDFDHTLGYFNHGSVSGTLAVYLPIAVPVIALICGLLIRRQTSFHKSPEVGIPTVFSSILVGLLMAASAYFLLSADHPLSRLETAIVIFSALSAVYFIILPFCQGKSFMIFFSFVPGIWAALKLLEEYFREGGPMNSPIRTINLTMLAFILLFFAEEIRFEIGSQLSGSYFFCILSAIAFTGNAVFPKIAVIFSDANQFFGFSFIEWCLAAAIFLFLVARLISLPAAMGDYIPVQKKAKRSAKATREIPEAVSAETDDSAEVEDIPETESNDEE